MPQTILIVDDEVNFLDILEIILQRAGYKTVVTANGLEAIDLVYQHHPNLIVLDDMLPGLSGSEICARLKRDNTIKDVPIILYSAGPRVRDREFIRQIGADAVLNKPFRPNDVVKMIRGFLDLPPAPTA